MHNIYSQADLTALAAQFQCCGAAIGTKALNAEKYGMADNNCYFNKMLYLNKASCLVSEYTLPGTLVTPGFVATASLDFTGETITPDYITGVVRINGSQIAVLPNVLYNDTNDLINGLVTVINTSQSIYTASNATVGATYILNIETTDPANQANGFVVNVIINPIYISTALPQEPSWKLHDAVFIDNPTASTTFRDKIIVSATQVDGGSPGFYNYIRILDGASYTNDIFVSFLPWPNIIANTVICYDAYNDRIYFTGYCVNPKVTYIDNLLNQSAAIPLPGGTPNDDVFVCYSPKDNHKYAVIAAGELYRLDKNDAPAVQILTGLTGASRIEVEPNSGDLWITGSTNVYVVETVTDTLVATIATGGSPKSVTYCSEVGNEMMIVSSYTLGSSFLSTYDVGTYAVIDAAYYTVANDTLGTTVKYIEPLNLIFTYTENTLPTGQEVAILDTSGTLHQEVTLTPDINTTATPIIMETFVYDPINSRIFAAMYLNVLAWDSVYSTPYELTLTNSGTDQFDGALEGGIPPVYTDGSKNCLDEDELQNVIEVSKSICCQINY